MLIQTTINIASNTAIEFTMQPLTVNLMRSTHQIYIVYTHCIVIFYNYYIIFVFIIITLVYTFYNIIIIY